MKYLNDKILKHRNDLDDYECKPNNLYNFIPSDSEKLWLENLKKNNHSIQYYKATQRRH